MSNAAEETNGQPPAADETPAVAAAEDPRKQIEKQIIYYPHNEQVDLAATNQDAESLDFSQTRLAEIQDFSKFTQLRNVCFRQNLLKTLATPNLRAERGLSQIRELDFYDNQIEKIEGLDELVTLESLDLSFNRLKRIENLDRLVNLVKLFLVHNGIQKMENLGALRKLKMLELGDNQLREIGNMDELTELEQLFLGKNKIRKLENLNLANLTILSIQSNRITKLENLEALVNLEEFYISDNGLKKIEGLERNERLRVLDLSNNQIERIENIGHLKQLEEFWFNHNNLAAWEDVNLLAELPSLKCLYLEHNPIYYVNNVRPSSASVINDNQSNNTAYRRRIILTLPKLEQLDATLCKRT